MPNARITNTSVNVGVKSTQLNVRVRQITSSTTTMTGGFVAGNPTGLLLALTYAFAGGGSSTTTSSDQQPNVRIK